MVYKHALYFANEYGLLPDMLDQMAHEGRIGYIRLSGTEKLYSVKGFNAWLESQCASPPPATPLARHMAYKHARYFANEYGLPSEILQHLVDERRLNYIQVPGLGRLYSVEDVDAWLGGLLSPQPEPTRPVDGNGINELINNFERGL